MERHHTGNHPKLPEARDVSGMNGFDVLDSEATVALPIPCLGRLVGVQGHAYRTVADGVSHNLQATAVQLQYKFPKFFWRVVGGAAKPRVIRVRLQHGS